MQSKAQDKYYVTPARDPAIEARFSSIRAAFHALCFLFSCFSPPKILFLMLVFVASSKEVSDARRRLSVVGAQ
jgi:hypothetical protein